MFELLLNADVYAPQALGQQHLLVCAGKIVWLGKDIPKLPTSFEVIETDLAGQRLIPGLIDGHAHLTGGGGEAGPATRVPPLALSRFTRGGITSAVGVLGTDDTTRTTAELLATARSLTAEGLSAWCLTGGYHLPLTTLTGSVRGDIVHLDRVIGVGELAISDHRSSQPTLDEVLRVAADAHVAGLMTGKAGILHLHLGDGQRGLQLVRDALDKSELPPRVFNPTHINRRRALFDEALELAERGCTIDITAFPVEDEEEAYSAEEAVTRYFAAGLPAEHLTVSSDGGGCLPSFDQDGRIDHFDVGQPAALAKTIWALLASGHSPEKVLPPFTSNVARHLRLPQKGRIEIGADADLVVLGNDGEVADVMAQGTWFVRQGKAEIMGTFEG